MLEFIIEIFYYLIGDGLSYVLWNTFFCAIFYHCVVRHWRFFTRNDVKFVRNIQFKMLMGQESMIQLYDRLYHTFSGERFFGIYELFGQPAYIIRDPELIKQINTTDFDHFINHRLTIGENTDPIFSRELFLMKNAKWKVMRATISPAFTGSKVRLMLSLVNECCEILCEYIKAEMNGKELLQVELKELLTRNASNTIASAAFGLNINSLIDKTNEFYRTGVAITNFEGLAGFKVLLYAMMPRFMNFFKITIFTKEQTDYFRHLVHDNIKCREENNIVRHDMINLLMEARKGMLNHNVQNNEKYDDDAGYATVQESELGKSSMKIQKWEDDDFVAQSVLFFFAGFNNIPNAQSFMGYELAINPGIQQKLYEEVIAAKLALNGKPLDYETLQKMKYMDMVVSETLRRWSPAAINERNVNKAYVMENFNGKKVQLNVGDAVYWPTHAIHMDPKYFPNPYQFDPERFNDENKQNIVPGTYAPFGIGPRNCMGSRLALVKIKSLFYYLLLSFSLEKCELTEDPLILKTNSFNLEAKNGITVKLCARG